MYKKKLFLSILFFVAFIIFACENVSKAKADEFENATTQIIKSDDKVNANIENSENEFQIELPTPHNEVEFGEIAKTVLMPGDSLRSKYIAEKFLENVELVNNVRGIQGYTGKWKGVPVTVMSSGMGIPSMGIYSWELYTGYGVENIIRIGTAGGLQDNINVKDIVIAQGVCTDLSFMHQFDLNGTFAPIADYTLLQTAVDVAKNKGIKPLLGMYFQLITFIMMEVIVAKNGRKWEYLLSRWKPLVYMRMLLILVKKHLLFVLYLIMFLILQMTLIRKNVKKILIK